MEDVRIAHEERARFWNNNPTREAVQPLHPDLPDANSYAVNVGTWDCPFRTASHQDPNNFKNSLSVLVFAGKDYVGGYYLLPRYAVALGSQPGAMLMHFSAVPKYGVHGTTDCFYTRY